MTPNLKNTTPTGPAVGFNERAVGPVDDIKWGSVATKGTGFRRPESVAAIPVAPGMEEAEFAATHTPPDRATKLFGGGVMGPGGPDGSGGNGVKMAGSESDGVDTAQKGGIAMPVGILNDEEAKRFRLNRDMPQVATALVGDEDPSKLNARISAVKNTGIAPGQQLFDYEKDAIRAQTRKREVGHANAMAAIAPKAAADVPDDESTWNKRPDGSEKQTGWKGKINRPDGTVMTEFSVSTELKDANGVKIDFPSIVPSTTPEEIEIIKNAKPGERLPREIIVKAEAHARERIAQGKSPFASDSETPKASSSAPRSPQSSNALPQGIIDYVKSGEGYKDKAYKDGAQYSIGWGTLATSPNEVITEDAANSRLMDELSASHANVTAEVSKRRWNLNPNQIQALTSFDYNAGSGAMRRIIQSSKTPEEMVQKMGKYMHSGGSRSQGLVNRRNSEAKVFRS